MRRTISIIGGGGWGTSLAVTMARDGHPVRMWVNDPDVASAIARTRENAVYLPGVELPDNIEVSNAFDGVLERSDIVLSAMPSHVCRSVFSRMLPYLRPEMSFVSATKGIENETLMRMSQVIEDVVGTRFAPRVAVLSGPTFAAEVARGLPTALVVASPEENLRVFLRKELSTPRFRLYTNSDTIGVEIGAAVKNIIAIAAGVVDGLGLGSNAKAALLTRGLAEIMRLAVACGGRRETLSGLAGLGDLVLTCHGDLSRNRKVGLALAHGRKLDEIVSSMRMVAEGVKTTQSAVALAHRQSIEMPIVEKIHAVLSEGLNPLEAINDLMERKLKDE